MRNIKALGLIAVSAMALVAFVGTSSAAGAEAKFTAGKAGEALSETTLEAHVLTIEGHEAECGNIGLSGTTAGTAYQEQTVSPSYSECVAFGFANAAVKTNGCSLTFKAETDEAEMATVDLSGCADATKGIQIEVNVPFFAKCVVDIPEQSLESAVGYTNGEGDVDVRITATEIMADVTTSTGLCPLTTGTTSTGAYQGESTVQAEGTSISWSSGEGDTFTAGKAGEALSETTLEAHVLTIEGHEAECGNIGLSGTTAGTAYQEQTVSPSYSECVAFGFANAAVKTNGCSLTFKAETDEAEMATVDLSGCADATKGIQIEVNVPFFAKCVVDIPEQSLESAVGYTNGEGDVDVRITATEIMADVTTSTGLCPLTTGTTSTGAYQGESTVQAEGTSISWSSGEGDTFTAGKAGEALSETTLEAHVLTIEGHEAECGNIGLSGTTAGTAYQEQTVSPSYSECVAFGFANAAVKTNGCSLTFKAETDEAEMATVDLSGCADATKGIQIEVNVPFFAKCVVDIPEQSLESAVGYTNGEGDVDVRITATEIMADVTTSTGLCPLTTGTTSTGAYQGESTVQAEGTSISWSDV